MVPSQKEIRERTFAFIWGNEEEEAYRTAGITVFNEHVAFDYKDIRDFDVGIIQPSSIGFSEELDLQLTKEFINFVSKGGHMHFKR